MAAVKNKDSKAELALRRALHARGRRYRLHAKDLPGRPDIVFGKYRVAVFVDGDMWHGNEHHRRGLDRLEDLFPVRTEWWAAKIRRNMERDREVSERLSNDGWHVLRIWESDILNDPEAAADRVCEALVEERPYAVQTTNRSDWLADPLPDEAWRPPPGLTKRERAIEQDQAAGGREERVVTLHDGSTALASVELKRFSKGRRIYAYLRWTHQGRTVNRYLGEVSANSRGDMLRNAWSRARSKPL